MSETLFSQFDKSTDEEWMEKISKDLKGKSVDDIAKKRPFEDLSLNVFYTASEKNSPIELNVQRDWNIITDEDYLATTIGDPLHMVASTGNSNQNEDIVIDSYIELVKTKKETENIGVNGTIYQASGASVNFELACILSHLNEYFHTLKEHNVLPINCLNHLSIKVGVGQDYFMEIAKLRALRILVQNLAKAYDLEANLPFQLYAENSIMAFSSSDHDTNILRSTTACMAAIIGGSDHITIKSHNMLSHQSDAFGDRIARNLQLMMKHEAYLDKVLDASKGSYYIENLTKVIAQKAWNGFKLIEEKGGFIASFKEGYLQSEIQKTADQRIQRFKEGIDVFIGINKHQVENGMEKRTFQHQQYSGQFKALTPIILEDVL